MGTAKSPGTPSGEDEFEHVVLGMIVNPHRPRPRVRVCLKVGYLREP